jgi:pyrimidine deaminase RibD-like protein
MASAATSPKQEAHELIEAMAPVQVSAVVGLLKVMLDPVEITLRNAPCEDELISDEENRSVAASKAWLAEHPGQGIPNKEILADFGLTAEDFERMGRRPIAPRAPGQ